MEIIDKNLRILSALILISLVMFGCKNEKKNAALQQKEGLEKPLPFTTPLAKEFTISEPSEKLLAQYEDAKKTFEAYPDSVETIIGTVEERPI